MEVLKLEIMMGFSKQQALNELVRLIKNATSRSQEQVEGFADDQLFDTLHLMGFAVEPAIDVSDDLLGILSLMEEFCGQSILTKEFGQGNSETHEGQSKIRYLSDEDLSLRVNWLIRHRIISSLDAMNLMLPLLLKANRTLKIDFF